MQMQQQGIGAYQPFLDAATQTQAGALGTVGRGVASLGQMDIGPDAYKQYHGSVSTRCYTRSIKRN
jgi:hypothetical protein